MNTDSHGSAPILWHVLWRVVPPAVLLLLGIWYAVSLFAERTVEQQFRQRLDNEASIAAEAASDRFALLVDSAAALAGNDLLVNALIDTEGRGGYLKSFFRSLRLGGGAESRISLLDYRGRVIASNGLGHEDSHVGAEWLALAMTGQTVTHFDGEALHVVVPVRYAGSPEGMLLIEYEAAQLPELLRIVAHVDVTAITDDTGRILYSSAPGEIAVGARREDLSGDRWAVAEASLPGLPKFRLLLAESVEEAFAPLRDLQNFLAIAVLADVLALIAGIILAAMLITRPLQGFIKKVISHRSVDILGQRMDLVGPAELRNLASCFNEMIESIESTTTSRSYLDSIIGSMDDLLIVFSPEGTILTFNTAATEHFGSLDGFLGKHLTSLPFLYDNVDAHDFFDPPPDMEIADRTETIHFAEDGRRTTISWRRTDLPATDGGGGTLFVGRDVTERRLAEIALRDGQQRIRAVLDTVLDGIITIDERGTIETLNPAAARLFGYEPDEVIGKNVKMLMPEPYEGEHDGYLGHYMKSGDAKVIGMGREVTGLRKDRTTFPMELAVSEMELGGRRMFTGIVRDITERRQAERALQDSEQRIRAILDTVDDGVLTIDRFGRVETLNPAAAELFGYRPDEVVGQNIKMLMADTYERQHDSYLRRYLDTGEAKVIGIGREVEGRRKDGSLFPMELAVTEMDLGGRRMFTGTIRDITERREADRKKNEFVSTVSHELRTPLTSIVGSLGLVTAGAVGEIDEEARGLIEIALSNSQRLVRLINDVLDIEKIEAGSMDFKLEPIALAEILERTVVENRGFGQEYGIELTFDNQAPDAIVLGDQDRLIQVYTNLISNAVKYSPQGRTVDISLRRHGAGVRVLVQDRGPGIPAEFQDRLFDKFAQADSADGRLRGGTGLGLNIAKAIVEQHGGKIGFETEIGEGTIFFTDLPLSDAAGGEYGGSNDPSPQPARPRILHVDADARVRRLISGLIDDVADVAGVGSLREAEAILRQGGIDTVILDLALPDGDAEALRAALERLDRASIPLVVFTAMEVPPEVSERAAKVLVKARTTNGELRAAIREIVSNRRAAA